MKKGSICWPYCVHTRFIVHMKVIFHSKKGKKLTVAGWEWKSLSMKSELALLMWKNKIKLWIIIRIMKIKAPLLLSKYECSCTVSIQI